MPPIGRGWGGGWGGPCQLSGCKPAEINPKRVIKERRIITIMFTTRKAAHTCHTLRAAEVAKGWPVGRGESGWGESGWGESGGARELAADTEGANAYAARPPRAHVDKPHVTSHT